SERFDWPGIRGSGHSFSRHGGMPAMLLDGRRVCARCRGISERPRWSARKNSNNWKIVFDGPRARSCAMTFSAVLLAGGESRRMGRDKATILFRGKPLWEVQLEKLKKLAPKEIFVSARVDPPWRPNDVLFVADVPPSRGPLSGLAASLN